MCFSDVVNQFHHVHGFTHTRATEQTNFTTLSEWANQINNFDTGFQQFLGWRQFVVGRCLTVNRCCLLVANRTAFIDRITQYVHNTTQRCFAGWYHDWMTCVADNHATTQTVRSTQSNRTDNAVAQLLLNFQSQLGAFHFQGIVNLRHRVTWEFNVHHSADTLNDFAISHVRSFLIFKFSLDRCRAGDDLGELFGNGSLTGFVINQFQLTNYVTCVITC